MIFHAFLIKYAEIAIKGKNRYLFEDALVKQMNIALRKSQPDRCKQYRILFLMQLQPPQNRIPPDRIHKHGPAPSQRGNRPLS